MKYYCMWHPATKWGAPVPILLDHKRKATMATGVSLGRMRELGYSWVTVEVNEPGEVLSLEDQVKAKAAEIERLIAECEELAMQMEDDDAKAAAATEGK